MKLATSSKIDFDGTVYSNSSQECKLKVLMVCIEEIYTTMANGKQFSTGNHPVEMLDPMLHLKKCYIDRKLISGASPLAANDFGKLSVIELLKEVNTALR